MDVSQLVATYSYVGDIISMAVILIMWSMIQSSLFFNRDYTFQIFKKALFFVFIGAAANLFFYLVVTRFPQQTAWIFITRDIYHVSLLSALLLFILYMRDMMEVPGKFHRIVSLTIEIVCAICCVADIISPITHFGFYTENGKWYDSTYIKPFTICYIIAIFIMAVLLICFGRNMIKQIRHALLFVEVLVIAILVMQNASDSNSYTCFTYLMPMLVVFTMLHSKPYDLITGAMEASVFPSYIEHLKKHEIPYDLVIMKLELDDNQVMPRELSKGIYSVWYSYFKRTELFRLQKGVYVLSIEHAKDMNAVGTLGRIMKNEFTPYYSKFNIPYRIVVIPNCNIIEHVDDIYRTISFNEQHHDINSMEVFDEKEVQAISRGRYILDQLANIREMNDLDDPRVLAYCQPVKNTHTDKFETAEVLMRMELPDIGLVFPDQFIYLAENYGYIHTLSLIILNKACIGVRKLLDDGYNPERVSVNFAVSELHSDSFCDEVLGIIHANNIPTEKIAIELTESQNDSDYNIVKERIQRLQKEGIRFYLDDFGTGYSNFDRVLSLNMDIIKFDRSLLLYAGDNGGSFSLKYFSKSLKAMDYKILFEGVETEEHENICRECKADYLQGYKYSKPIPFMRFEEFLEK